MLVSFRYNPFQVEGFAFGRYEKKASYIGKLDTGTSIIYLPQALFNAIYKAIKPQFDEELQLYTTDCLNEFDDWVFNISGKAFELSTSEYIVDVSDIRSYDIRFSWERRSVWWHLMRLASHLLLT
jgi:hypothetical protein